MYYLAGMKMAPRTLQTYNFLKLHLCTGLNLQMVHFTRAGLLYETAKKDPDQLLVCGIGKLLGF